MCRSRITTRLPRPQTARAGLIVLAGLLALLPAPSAAAEGSERSPKLPESTPWDLAALRQPPQFEWVDQSGPVHALLYTGEPYRGRPTRIFAYYASPGTLAGDPSQDRRLPAVVLVHGGGGTAFREWAELWARRGYAALAMDLAGARPIEGKNPHQRENRVRLDDGGPDQTDAEKFGAIGEPVTEHWPYHAVASVIRGHSLLRSLPGVDADRTAVTGISWGGYLTCLVASLDSRFRAAVPVYGCGFLHENSAWTGTLHAMAPELRERWIRLYDPSQYLPACQVPILFVNGTNDFAYPLDSDMKSYRAVPGPKNLRITVNMPHGHPPGWKPEEIGAFVDQSLRDGMPLPRLGPPEMRGGRCTASVEGKTKPVAAELHFTIDAGPVNKRRWTTIPADVSEAEISVHAPPPETTVWFFTTTDRRGLTVSSEVVFRMIE